MKVLYACIFSISLAFLAAATSFAQEGFNSGSSNEIKDRKLTKTGLPRGARLISVTTDLPKDQLYQKTARAMSEKGFVLKASDPALGIIQTGHKKVKGGWWLRVTATVDDNVVKFTGVAAGQRYGGQELTNSGSNRYIFCFEAMDELAKSIPNSKIEYLP